MWKLRKLVDGMVIVTIAWIVSSCGTETPTLAPGQPTDADITAAVETEYLLHMDVDHEAIDVTTINGVLTLSGTVEDLLGKMRAVEAATAIRGVRSIVDQIEVDPPELSDEALTSDVFQAILDDPATESYEIDATVEDGTVTLSGAVDSWADKQLAYDVIAGVRGVRSIDNELTIRFVERSDHEIKADIERRLQEDVLVDAGLIEVAVDDAIVELTGVVGSSAERKRALNDSYVAGVLNVDVDDLEIRWWARDDMRRKDLISDLTDPEVEDAVTDALVYDPRVIGSMIDVSAYGGLVTLKGTVGSLREEQAAIEDARNTFGVWDVFDSLEVPPSRHMTDTEIEKFVREALLRDPHVYGLTISVEVEDGTAYLGGIVDNLFEKLHAEWVVSNLRAVVGVENGIGVLEASENTVEPDDSGIAHDFRQKLLWSPWLADADLTVNVTDGVVSVTGSVDGRFETYLLTKIADEVGASGLELDVTVERWPSPPNVGVELPL